MALNGKTRDQMYSKILSWGVTKQTADSYMLTVVERIKLLHSKKQLYSTSFRI